MAISFSFSVKDDWLLARASGDVQNVDELCAKSFALVRKAQETNRKKMLLDNREQNLQIDTFGATQVAQALDERTVQGLGIKCACLCSSQNLNEYSMLETVYRNRSINYRVFTDEQAALDWLLS